MERITAHKAKTRQPYSFVFGDGHKAVLDALLNRPGLSDADLTFRLGRHMIAPRRCELRDAGLVVQAGRQPNGMTWKLSPAGEQFARSLRSLVAA